MKRQALMVMFVLILLMLSTNCTDTFRKSHQELSLIDANTEQVIWSATVNTGDQFILEYTHSVHKTPVKDYFEISDDNQLVLYKTAFSTYGAGMPFESEFNFMTEDGFFVIDSLNRTMSSFLLRIVPLADHKLILGNQTVTLNDLVSPNTLLVIAVE
jgi:hypothetical protein